jgi:hypothetical protein
MDFFNKRNFDVCMMKVFKYKENSFIYFKSFFLEQKKYRDFFSTFFCIIFYFKKKPNYPFRLFFTFKFVEFFEKKSYDFFPFNLKIKKIKRKHHE